MNRHHIRPILATLAIAIAAGLTAILGGPAYAQSTDRDYDTDNDNLIEISTLEQLNAVRWDLDGNGADPTDADAYRAAFPDRATDMGCAAGASGCKGYELAKSLDFNDDASYADADTNKTVWTPNRDSSNVGWAPLGLTDAPFTSTFHGNGHTISNLYVNITVTAPAGIARAGLFGSIGSTGVVKNVGVTGSVTAKMTTTTNADSAAYAGGLAGWNNGDITDSWADVRVEAKTSGPEGAAISAYAGGLVGLADSGSEILRSFALGDVTADDAPGGISSYANAGGLVGQNAGRIGASFATGVVKAVSGSGTSSAGGLVGNHQPTNATLVVSASYATGRAEATSNNVEYAGGLAGRNNRTIEASYSRGTVTISGGGTGNSNAGGLVGGGDGTATASYWDTETSGLNTSVAGTGKTTSDLQTPTAYGTADTDIYKGWNVNYDGAANTGVSGADDPWHFGTASDYPRLRGFDPMLDDVTVPSSGTLGPGSIVTVIVTFDKLVKVVSGNGNPSLAIAVGDETRTASYVGTPGTASKWLPFAYTVARGDNGPVTVPNGSISLNGGTITDLSELNPPLSLAFTDASVPADLNAVTVPFDTTKPSVRYKPPSSLTVGQRIRTIVPITDDTDIASYALKEGSVLPRTLRLDEKTGYITGRPTRAVGRATTVTIIVCDNEVDALGNNPNPNCAEVTLKLPAIIDEEADAPPPEPQLPEVPPLDLSSITVGDAAPTPTLLLALAGAGAALLLTGIGTAAVRRRAPSRRRRRT